MIFKGFQFSLLTFGLAFVVSFAVAGIIKLIAIGINRRRSPEPK